MKNIGRHNKIALVAPTVFLAVLFLSGCGRKNDWSLFVYPNGDLGQKSINSINAYGTFSECEKGFEFNRRSFPNAKFECGYKCKVQDSELGLYICDETRDN